MFLKCFSKLLRYKNNINHLSCRTCSVFGLKELILPEKTENFTIKHVKSEDLEVAIELIKNHFLSEHVFVRERNMDLNDHALDEYLYSLMKQGNTLYARAEDGTVAGICVNYASSPVDPGNLRIYAHYRQNQDTKDFLCFTSKLQETPNLWELYKEPKIFEIKMLTVLPQFRRQGLSVLLAEKSKEQALDQGYKTIRMDCINPYDYKVAERCLLHCLVKFPLHKLRGVNAPYIRRSSEHNRIVRVYVDARTQGDAPDHNHRSRSQRQAQWESLVE